MPPPTVMPELFVKMARKVIRESKDYEFWHWLCRARPPAAANVARLKDEDKICEIIKSNHDAFVNQTQKGRPSNGKGRAKGQTAKGTGKGKHKGIG